MSGAPRTFVALIADIANIANIASKCSLRAMHSVRPLARSHILLFDTIVNYCEQHARTPARGRETHHFCAAKINSINYVLTCVCVCMCVSKSLRGP